MNRKTGNPDPMMAHALQTVVKNVLNAPDEAKARLTRDPACYVEIPVTEAGGTVLNTFVIISSAAGFCAAFWRKPCTAKDAYRYASIWGAQHPTTSVAFENLDVNDSIAGCMGFPGSVSENSDVAKALMSYQANLALIFGTLKTGSPALLTGSGRATPPPRRSGSGTQGCATRSKYTDRERRAFVRECPKELWAQNTDSIMVMFATKIEKDGALVAEDRQQYCVDHGVVVFNPKKKTLKINGPRVEAMMKCARWPQTMN